MWQIIAVNVPKSIYYQWLLHSFVETFERAIILCDVV
jgi:hypothetical protein